MRIVDKSPEHKLWFAMLIQAVQDLHDPTEYVRSSAERWIADDSMRPTGFRWCCDLFDANHVAFRANAKSELMRDSMRRAWILLNRGHADGENEESHENKKRRATRAI